ncbi:hypothetical protein, partial [Escherichia coli]|uniref:hypothetical protein n=1 Tax=Escherichia coli TaxID=562 RepID=UPI001BE41AED
IATGSALWMRVVDGGSGRRKLGGRAPRRIMTPDCEGGRSAHGVGFGSGSDGLGSGSSSVKSLVGDVST